MSTTTALARDSRAQTNGLFHSPIDTETSERLEAWLAGSLWHDDAPRSLKKAWGAPSVEEAWAKWTEHLASRKFAGLVPSDSPKIDPLDWGLPAGDSPVSAVAEWRKQLDRQLQKAPGEKVAVKVESTLAEWLHELEDGPVSVDLALKSVAVAYRLASIAPHTPAGVWWRMVNTLVNLAEETATATAEDLEPETTLVATLLSGELPLVLSLVLPELSPTRSLRAAGRKSLGEGLLAATDGEGILDAALLTATPMLVASWTRARAMGEELKKGCWTGAAETQYEWLVRQTVRLLRVDGTPVFGDGALVAWPAGVLDVALELAGDLEDDAAAAARLGKLLSTVDPDYEEGDLPDASAESEWSSLAVLATGWDKNANRVVVDYSRPEMRIEVEAAGRPLISGVWRSETHFAGKQLQLVDDWEQQCWFNDEECDFLDLVIELSGGCRLERQIFLAKDDGFLMTHDILHGPSSPAGEWRHHVGLPLASGIEFVGEEETRDGVLSHSKAGVRATVLPLALAEWRVDPRRGELTSNNGSLELLQQGRGARLSCPLWFDLRSRRAGRPRTWRQLTVAASLEVAPSDVAVGYRVQVGDSQWLLYRSLAAPANRTVMGENTAAEFLIGRYHRSGEFDELLAVDPA